MCGRITRTSPREAIAKEFVTRFARSRLAHPRYNVAPSQIVETIISVEGEKRLGPMRWRLVSPTPRSRSLRRSTHWAEASSL
jgi:putative SOS response-associated peptidase YedK